MKGRRAKGRLDDFPINGLTRVSCVPMLTAHHGAKGFGVARSHRSVVANRRALTRPAGDSGERADSTVSGIPTGRCALAKAKCQHHDR